MLISGLPRDTLRARMNRFTSLLVIALAAGQASLAAAAPESWQPIDPGELAATSSIVEPGADAEGMFWQIRVEDSMVEKQRYTQFWNYVRVKLFTTAGVENYGRLQLPSGDRSTLDQIAARAVLPDGRMVDLKPDDVFERTAIHGRGRRERVRAFVVPSVVPGSIVEYRWHETESHSMGESLRLAFHSRIPFRRITYDIKPLALSWESGLTMKTLSVNGSSSPFQTLPDGFVRTTMINVPSVPRESDMPAEDRIAPWMLLWYGERRPMTPDKYWQRLGKVMNDLGYGECTPSRALRDGAAAIVEGARTPDEKLLKLYEYCRSKVRNLSDDASGLSDDEQAKLEDAPSAKETLDKRQGTAFDVNRLFGTLAASLGMETRLVWLSDRSERFFDPSMMTPYAFDQCCVGVRTGGSWRFFDPAATEIPFGALPWWIEGTMALIPDAQHTELLTTASSGSSDSRWRRSGSLRLSPEGTLEGDCRIETTGHVAEELRDRLDDQSEADRKESLRRMLEEDLGAGEYTQIVAQGLEDPAQPFTVLFRARIPSYAQRTGKRIFLQPALFQHGRPPRFADSHRRFPVAFEYAWAEDDSLLIVLPQGYSLEASQVPAELRFGNFGSHALQLQVSDDGRMILRRSFHFDRLAFDLDEYPQLKQDWEQLHQNDGYTLTLLSGP